MSTMTDPIIDVTITTLNGVAIAPAPSFDFTSRAAYCGIVPVGMLAHDIQAALDHERASAAAVEPDIAVPPDLLREAHNLLLGLGLSSMTERSPGAQRDALDVADRLRAIIEDAS